MRQSQKDLLATVVVCIVYLFLFCRWYGFKSGVFLFICSLVASIFGYLLIAKYGNESDKNEKFLMPLCVGLSIFSFFLGIGLFLKRRKNSTHFDQK